MAQVFVQLTLPHERTNTLYFETPQNGNLSLSIRAHKAYGVPYGSKSRLILSWLVTEAVRTQSPELLLGRSQRDFALNKLEISYTGRELIALKHQCLALVRSIISIDANLHCNSFAYQDIQISSKGFICWSDKNPEQPGLAIKYERKSFSICEQCGSDQGIPMSNDDRRATICPNCNFKLYDGEFRPLKQAG